MIERPKVSDRQLVAKWVSLKESAQKRNIEFNVSLRKLRALLATKRCFYTGVVFSNLPEHGGRLGRTIDRADSQGGYTDDNIVACTNQINTFKDKVDFELMVKIVKRLAIIERKKAKTAGKRVRKIVI